MKARVQGSVGRTRLRRMFGSSRVRIGACALALVSVCVACSSDTKSAVASSGPAAPSSGAPAYPIGTCAPKGMAGVYWSFRLHDADGGTSQDDCGTIRGTVMQTHQESDGDLHIKVQLDPSYQHYLAPGNKYQDVPSHCAQLSVTLKSCVDDLMVLEIIPQHCHGHYPYSDNCADRGAFADPAAPSAGDHIEATGYSVRDYDPLHRLEGYPKAADGWAELHPVTGLRVITSAPAGTPNPTDS